MIDPWSRLVERYQVYPMNKRKGHKDAIEKQGSEKDHGSGSAQPHLRGEGGDTAEGGEGIQPGGRQEGQEPPAWKKPQLSEQFASNVMIIAVLICLLAAGFVYWWLG